MFSLLSQGTVDVKPLLSNCCSMQPADDEDEECTEPLTHPDLPMAMMRSPLLPRPATNTPAAANTLRARFKTPGVTPSRYVGPAVTPSRYADYQGDKYNLLTVLGKGAFGLVTLMRRADDGALVAMKTVDRYRLTSAHLRQTVVREIDILQALPHHAGIVALLEVIETARSIHMVMEYCDDGTLQALLVREGALSEARARPFVSMLMDAIAHLHAHRVCHRDLKLDNCVLTKPDGEKGGGSMLRLIDFGLSTTWKEGAPPLRRFCGSLCYAAPEVLRRRYYGAQADAWSLGVCVCAMLGGTLPFQAADEEGLRSLVLAGTYELPTRDRLSLDSRNLISGLLMLDADERLTVAGARDHGWLQE